MLHSAKKSDEDGRLMALTALSSVKYIRQIGWQLSANLRRGCFVSYPFGTCMPSACTPDMPSARATWRALGVPREGYMASVALGISSALYAECMHSI